MTEQFLTVEETATRLKVAPFTVRVWLREGKIEGVKLGKVWRVLVASLDALARPKQNSVSYEVGETAAVGAMKARLQKPLGASEIAAKQRAAREMDALFAQLNSAADGQTNALDFTELIAAGYDEREREQS